MITNLQGVAKHISMSMPEKFLSGLTNTQIKIAAVAGAIFAILASIVIKVLFFSKKEKLTSNVIPQPQTVAKGTNTAEAPKKNLEPQPPQKPDQPKANSSSDLNSHLVHQPLTESMIPTMTVDQIIEALNSGSFTP